MGKYKSIFTSMMEDESQFVYAVTYYDNNDVVMDVRGAYIQCDSIWNVKETFQEKYHQCTIIDILCMNSKLVLSSNGKTLKILCHWSSLNKYLKWYREKNISIKVEEERTGDECGK